jgi:hypothetical protein
MCTVPPRHGLGTPRESFFQKFQTFWLRQTFWVETLGIFSAGLSALIFVLSSLSMFSIIQPLHYFYNKPSLYIQLSNIFLGVGFEFGLQRI